LANTRILIRNMGKETSPTLNIGDPRYYIGDHLPYYLELTSMCTSLFILSVLLGQCVWKTIIRLGLGKKADIITKFKQQQQQQENASEVTVIIGYTKWHGVPN